MWRGLSTEGNLHFKKIDLLSFTLYLRAISKYKPWGVYIWRGDLMEGFSRHEFGGIIFGGAYTWRGLFSEFTVWQKEKEEAHERIDYCSCCSNPDCKISSVVY